MSYLPYIAAWLVADLLIGCFVHWHVSLAHRLTRSPATRELHKQQARHQQAEFLRAIAPSWVVGDRGHGERN